MTKRRLLSRPIKIGIFVIIGLLIIARSIAPGLILDRLNTYLANFSDNYYAHIEDLDINLWRGAYNLDHVVIALKKNPEKPFLTAEEVDVSIAWREILRGRILTDVVVENAIFEGDTEFATTAQNNTEKSEKEAREAGTKLFPTEVERIEIKNSTLNYKERNLFVNQINGRLSHFSATEKNPLSLLTLQGHLLGKAPMKIVGHLNFLTTPTAWVFAAELQQFGLVDGNKLIKEFIPLTFKKGELDVYAEIKSEKAKMSGYLKPFLKDAEIMGDDGDFKGIKHFGVELSVAFLNLFFRSSKDHVLATKILFTRGDGKFEWNVNEMLTQLFKNGYQEELAPGIENLLSIHHTKNNIDKEKTN